MKDQQALAEEFLSRIQSMDDLKQFLVGLQKRGLEKLLGGELSAHLGYDKNEKS